MAFYGPMIRFSWPADVDLSSKQFYFVKAASANDDQVNLATGASNPYPLGVLQNEPEAGEAAEVCLFGISKLYVSSSIAWNIGDFLFAGSGGAAEYDSTAATSCPAQAIALQNGDAGTATISALILPPGMRCVADQAY